MSTNVTSPKLEDLLRRSTWARRLARHLVGRREDADDLLQEAWLVATQKAARGQAASPPWLSGVIRVLGMNKGPSGRAAAATAMGSSPCRRLDPGGGQPG